MGSQPWREKGADQQPPEWGLLGGAGGTAEGAMISRAHQDSVKSRISLKITKLPGATERSPSEG